MTDVNLAWTALLENIMSAGHLTHPRGVPTKEILGCKSVISMCNPVITINERALGYRFLPAEAAWIIGGYNTVDDIRPYSKAISNFSDDGAFFFGAYGPRIKDQLPHVIAALRRDFDTRQAVLTIWRESPPASKDIPCTVSLQWTIRDNELHCFANMRSSDAWLGVPYDWFNFSMVSAYLLLWLRKLDTRFGEVQLGNLHFYAASQHLYATNWDAVREILDKPTSFFTIEPLNVDEFKHPEDLRCWLWTVADNEFIGNQRFLMELRK
ncbi:thymidylate synthase [Candidatus Accumulibacter vicinus]|jgi:thymidylate synthase|uniref:Thymidylate synthase n=1 Tax=Candidatus Accumulibacter vicinus TaxID=2954382 RepID=A0A084XUC7_9PROT|nr:thymidylate synthase [Candidatus Accumulibacter vicinus]KFB66071.1 MAG: Thymidylate synthase [Candidatus Accumulibacter vicinus]